MTEFIQDCRENPFMTAVVAALTVLALGFLVVASWDLGGIYL